MGYYAIIPNNILRSNELSSSEKLFYAEISRLLNDDGLYEVNYEYLINILNTSKRSIQRMINTLHKHDFVRCDRYNNKTILRMTNLAQQYQNLAHDDKIVAPGYIIKSEKAELMTQIDTENRAKKPHYFPIYNNNNNNNNTLLYREEKFKNDIHLFVQYDFEMLEEFCDYWVEPNKSNTKMRFECEKTWNNALRLKRWARNYKPSKQSKVQTIISDKQKAMQILKNK